MPDPFDVLDFFCLANYDISVTSLDWPSCGPGLIFGIYRYVYIYLNNVKLHSYNSDDILVTLLCLEGSHMYKNKMKNDFR